MSIKRDFFHHEIFEIRNTGFMCRNSKISQIRIEKRPFQEFNVNYSLFIAFSDFLFSWQCAYECVFSSACKRNASSHELH